MAMERSMRPPLARWIQCTRHKRIHLPLRTFTTTAPSRLETEQQQPPSEPAAAPPPPPVPTDTQSKKRDPYTVSTPAGERQLLLNQRLVPIGSRRRRAAIASTSQIPFSQLPYQCFQEARSLLQDDRQEKLEAVRVQRERLERLRMKDVAPQDQWQKDNRMRDMRKKLEELKILVDINDPVVKRRFEDGKGDMNKPIYRYLANRQWRSYNRVLLMQRITQMNVVPDILPKIDPAVSTRLAFPATNNSRMKRVPHGDFVDSLISEKAPTLWIQPYERGTKLVTIAVVNPDVPNVEKDGFDYRCHFLAANIPISPTDNRIKLGELDAEKQVIHDWLPAYAQKGTPYQRMSVFVLEQPTDPSSNASATLDISTAPSHPRFQRKGFNLRAFVDRYRLEPIGVDLFRTNFDGNTAGVMRRAGVEGWDVEFKRKRIEPLPYKRRDSERYR